MTKKKDYHVICRGSLQLLIDTVGYYLDDGWEGMCEDHVDDTHPHDSSNFDY